MTKEQKIIRAKIGLLELARQLGNVSQACKMMGYSRDSFYRFKELYEARRRVGAARADAAQTDLEEPHAARRRGDHRRAFAGPAGLWPNPHRQRASQARPFDFAGPGCAGVWQRHDLETMKKRLKALEAKVAQEGLVLTESQLAALEKAKSEKEAHGEFESECPGYCGAPGYVLRRQHEGGRPHLPADLHRHLHAKVAFAKLYDPARRPSPLADLVNDRVVAVL